ncbi:type III secretion system stator protein SctL [Paraburkholderia bannensis]|uniref:type III secretion system stator protein SctL n=1 Tax=Paraburkholderia bannensis TaxID=765414 RepID=UPI002AB1A095|nr:type III secretion system stator protein SctL [Paraburkholderia bannensis]
MVIWLNHAARDGWSLGVDQDVLGAGEFATLMELDASLAQARADADALLAAAREEAASILQSAQQQADELNAELDAKFESSGRLGYAAGLQRGIDEIHRNMQSHVRDEQHSTRLAQERLARLVMKAAEQVVLESDRDALFARVGATLARVIERESYVTLTVSADDHDRTRSMLEQVAQQAGWQGGFDVRIDPAAAPGACVCEWDCGVLDASLPAQLTALRRALKLPARGDEAESHGASA